MESMPQIDDDGLLDMADLDSDLVAPDDWEIEQDQLPFEARDKDVDADG